MALLEVHPTIGPVARVWVVPMPMAAPIGIPGLAPAETPPIPTVRIAGRSLPVAMRPLEMANPVHLPMPAIFRRPNRRAIVQRSCLTKSVSVMQKK